MKPRKAKQPRNIALFVPRPLVGHNVDEEGRVILHVPRFRARWLQWLMKRLKKPYIRLGFDQFGSATWKLIDGQRTVIEISAALEKEFGEKIQPAKERVGMFIGTLHKNRFITLEGEESPAPAELGQ